MRRFLYIAAKEGEKSTCKYRLGAIAISKGQVVSKGFNRYIGDCDNTKRRGECSIHAEQIALNRTGSAQVDTVGVVRLSAQQGFSMAHPCKRCVAHARRAGVQYIYYTDWSGNVQKFKVM